MYTRIYTYKKEVIGMVTHRFVFKLTVVRVFCCAFLDDVRLVHLVDCRANVVVLGLSPARPVCLRDTKSLG